MSRGNQMSGKDRRRRVKAVIRRDGAACWWCKRHLHEHEVTLDHVIPRSAGGSNRLSNLRLSCAPCNQLRGGVHGLGGFLDAGTPSRPKAARG